MKITQLERIQTMNKIIRIVVVLAFLIAIVALGMKGTAWAGKLGAGNQSPAASGYDQGSHVGSRQVGTVATTNLIIPITGGQETTVGSCATVLINSAPADVSYISLVFVYPPDQNGFLTYWDGTQWVRAKSVLPFTDLAEVHPGTMMSCGIKIDATPIDNLGAEVQVCFPIPPNQTGYAYYWDSTLVVTATLEGWVKTTLEAKDNQSCVNIPASAGNPAFAALFDK
jgi:hypothetical protein